MLASTLKINPERLVGPLRGILRLYSSTSARLKPAISRGNASQQPRRGRSFVYAGISLVLAAPLAYKLLPFTFPNLLEQPNCLDPSHFLKFDVTMSVPIESDLFLVELEPRQGSNDLPWDSTKVWSVQVKNPLMQTARRYTPIPVHFEGGSQRLQVNNPSSRRFCLLVRRYDNGDTSRYICSRQIGDVLELRGPIDDADFGCDPVNRDVVFFTAGTGFAVPLQVALSPGSDSYARLRVFQSFRQQISSLSELLRGIQSRGLLEIELYVDCEQKFINAADIPKCDTLNCAVVCGPPGYVSFVAGDPGHNWSKPVGGLLGPKGWTIQNTIRLLDV